MSKTALFHILSDKRNRKNLKRAISSLTKSKEGMISIHRLIDDFYFSDSNLPIIIGISKVRTLLKYRQNYEEQWALSSLIRQDKVDWHTIVFL